MATGVKDNFNWFINILTIRNPDVQMEERQKVHVTNWTSNESNLVAVTVIWFYYSIPIV